MKSPGIAPLLLSLAAVVAGCATGPNTTYAPLPARAAAPAAKDVGFTDDASRQLVLQTRSRIAKRDLNYLVGPDDVLEINILEWQGAGERDTLNLRVSKKGEIAMPGLGAVKVADLSVEDIQALIVDKLQTIAPKARVGVAISEHRSKRVSVVGAVVAPGVYALTENVASLLEIISLAGGPSAGAGNAVYVLQRAEPGEEPVQIEIDLDELFRTGSAELDAVLSHGDTVYIPKAPTVSLYGAVRSPGRVAIVKDLTLMEAIANSGGLTDQASKSDVRVERREGNRLVKYSVNLASLERSGRGNLPLQEGDIVYINENESKAAFLSFVDFFRGIFTASYRVNP